MLRDLPPVKFDLGGVGDEKAHRTRLVATFAPKFSRLPNEVVGVVMMFYAHVGFY